MRVRMIRPAYKREAESKSQCPLWISVCVAVPRSDNGSPDRSQLHRVGLAIGRTRTGTHEDGTCLISYVVSRAGYANNINREVPFTQDTLCTVRPLFFTLSKEDITYPSRIYFYFFRCSLFFSINFFPHIILGSFFFYSMLFIPCPEARNRRVEGTGRARRLNWCVPAAATDSTCISHTFGRSGPARSESSSVRQRNARGYRAPAEAPSQRIPTTSETLPDTLMKQICIHTRHEWATVMRDSQTTTKMPMTCARRERGTGGPSAGYSGEERWSRTDFDAAACGR